MVCVGCVGDRRSACRGNSIFVHLNPRPCNHLALFLLCGGGLLPRNIQRPLPVAIEGDLNLRGECVGGQRGNRLENEAGEVQREVLLRVVDSEGGLGA